MDTKDSELTKTRITDIDNDAQNSAAKDNIVTDSAAKNNIAEDSKIESNVSENKGTDTFKEGVVASEHVNEADNPARQPDRRDQAGSTAFDDNVNEDTVGSAAPKSQDINDLNRYASIDNAQTRVLNPDQKDA